MNPFEVLGLEPRFVIDRKALEARYRELQKALHPDRHVGAGASTRRMSLERAVTVNEAYRVLGDDLRRAEALLTLRGGAVAQDVDPALLMQVMERREALGEARERGDLAAVRALGAEVDAEAARVRDAIGVALDADPPAVDDAASALARLKYLQRFLDEVGAIEEAHDVADGAA
jgi:molecular chaperone HscB